MDMYKNLFNALEPIVVGIQQELLEADFGSDTKPTVQEGAYIAQAIELLKKAEEIRKQVEEA
jgi:hypothetical protein